VPKDWSFDQWPLRRKLAAALVFPMLLAVVLGGLRVKSEFDQATAFSAAAERTEVLRPLIEFNAAAQTLASSAVPGGPARNPATVAFDRIAQQLENRVKSGTLGPVAKREISSALSNGRALRNAVGQATAFSVVIDKATATARTTSSAVADLGLSGDDATAKTIAAIQDAIAARQAMTSQQLNLANKDDAGASIFAIGQIGAEASFLTRLKDESSPASRNAVQRATYENYRRSVTLQGGDLDETDTAFINDGYRSSNQAYDSVVQGELQQLESTLTSRASEHRTQALVNSALVLLALLAALALVVALAKSLLGPIRRVREGALEVANKRLPEAVARIRDGEDVPEFEPIPVTTHEEMGQLARAVDDLHKQALTLAGDQARLRVQVGHMFETLSRRSTSLIDQQLTLIENLESDEEDPKRLQSLFRLDHLAARMRRNSDSLLVLAGTSTRRGVSGAISVSDAVRAAVSEVENYERIDIGEISGDQVLGAVGSDLIHLVAEVVDNALSYSPPTTRVDIRGARTPDGGLLIEVTDHGLGMPPKELAALNDRLANGGDVTADTARRMGLFVVGSLAKRHGVAVRLRRNGGDQNGITVSLHLPAGLLADSTVVRAERGPAAARGAVAPAPSAVAPLAPAPPTSAVGGTTKAGLPTRVRGASGATPSPVPGATKKLPTRNPGAHGPGAPAERPATPAKPVVESAHGPAPAPEPKPATNGHANGHPADAKPHNGHEAEPQAGPDTATAAATTAGSAVTPADAKDTTKPEGDKAPEARRSPAGLPVRQRNASRITEYREFEASPEPASSEQPTEPATGSKPAPAPKQSRLTSWLPGRKAAAEAARAEAEAGEPRQMPSNLSAWLDHRAKLAEAAKASESGESSQTSPTDEPAPSAEAAEPSTESSEGAAAGAPDSSIDAFAAPAAEVATEPAQTLVADEAVTESVRAEVPEEPVQEPAHEVVTTDPSAATERAPESAQPEAAGGGAAVPDALPTRVPGMSGSTALRAAEGPAPRLVRRPLATSYFGARKAVDVEPAAEPAVAEPAVAEPAVAEPAVAERVDTAPAVAEPVVAERADVEPAVEEPVAGHAPAHSDPEPLPPAPASAYNDANDTPIFRAMMSNWLTDDTSAASGSWSTSEADAAWTAAARTEAQEPMEESSAGLPKRRPGSHLVPGAIEAVAEAPVPPPTGSRRDPETIRRNLSRHHQGVSSARTEAQDGTQREEADVHH
jgi:signal transduction histidine kinase